MLALDVASTEAEPAKPSVEIIQDRVIFRCLEVPSPFSSEINKILSYLKIIPLHDSGDQLEFPRTVSTSGGAFDLAKITRAIEHYLEKNSAHVSAANGTTTGLPPTIDTKQVLLHGRLFAEYLETNRASLVRILTSYETHEVANDEIDRCIDLFSHLAENKQYFTHKINAAASFLPRNQPLYALSCFGLVPSYMAVEMNVRPPEAMHFFFKQLEEELKLSLYFPNVKLNLGKRQAFVDDCCRQFRNPRTERMEPLVDAVIFTGTMENANNLREQLDPRTLLIANGAGHNPVVIGENANLQEAVRSVVRVQLYNQGQDCANPSAILVHRSCSDAFLKLLRAEVQKVKVGAYKDPQVRVGPITEGSDLPRIRQIFIDNAQWLDPSTPGVIDMENKIVEPTIIVKPLRDGSNFIEQFSPVFFLQEYEMDSELALFFETEHYRKNAMYVSIFGTSAYVDRLVTLKQPDGRPLHDESTIIRNKDLHAPGVERGTQPYGGFGRGASCYSINGVVTALPTLPQRDIHGQIVVPRLQSLNTVFI